jgi:phosphonate metabolism protein PhnN/1,5-bisphosphokinase (PRPP-forming)
MTHGTLILVVGPSGAGKDSVIAGAAEGLRGDARIMFARRLITRPADSGGEAHIAATASEFAILRERGELMLYWHAHGLDYALPQELATALETGCSVVANVSRSIVAEARRLFKPTLVIAVWASPATLAARLGARGRETAAEIERRLDRIGAISPDQADFIVNNDGPLETAVARFVKLLREKIDQAPAIGS